MYARLCAASSPPSISLPCTHLSRLRRFRPSGERLYVALAALAARPPQSKNLESGSGSNNQTSATTRSASPSRNLSKTISGSLNADPPAKSARKKQKVDLATRQEAEEAERRRKALAVLGKSSKFDAKLREGPFHEPTLLDLERLRPKRPPLISFKYIYPEFTTRVHHESPSDAAIERHDTAFEELATGLMKKFRRKQLLNMYKEGTQQMTSVRLGLPRTVSSLGSHRDVAREIVRRIWKWPSGAEVKQRKVYLTERSERVFPIGASEFFLLLGPDGSSLLGLTENLKVVIKQVVRTQDAFSLIINGPNYSLDRLVILLTERKKAILSKAVSVKDPHTGDSTPSTETNSIRPELLQRISKLSEALVEDTGHGMFRISALHPQKIELATRLTTRASQQAALPPPSLLAHFPTARDAGPNKVSPHTYALFPLELPKAAALPWNWISTGALFGPSSSASPQNHHEYSSTAMYSTGIPSLFRARNVSEWIEQDRAGNVSHLRDGFDRMLSSAGELHTLRDALGMTALVIPNAMSDTSSRRKITASTGYIVFAAEVGVRDILSPPLPGSWIFPNLLDWMRTDKGRVAFIPNRPKPQVQCTSSDQTILNQLVYRSLMSDTPALERPFTTSHPADPSKTLKVDILLKPPTQAQGPLAMDGHDSQRNGNRWNTTANVLLHDGPVTDTSIPAGRLQVLSGVESLVNIMLPDRPIDMQLSIFDSVPVPPDFELPEIRTYASALIRCLNVFEAVPRPHPPLHVTHEGTRYVLDSNATIRRSSQSATEVRSSTDILTEHVVDLESDQQTATCQVICTKPNTSPTWQKFLRDCDSLTLT